MLNNKRRRGKLEKVMDNWKIPPTTKGLLDSVPSKERTLSSYASDQKKKDLIQKGLIRPNSTGGDDNLPTKYWQNAEETLADRLVELGRSNIEYAHLHNISGKEIWHGPTETSKQAQKMGKGLLTLIKAEDIDYNYNQDIDKFKPKQLTNKEKKAISRIENILNDTEETNSIGNGSKEKSNRQKFLNSTRMNVVSITHDPDYVEATNIKRVEAAWKTSLYTTEEVCMSCNLLSDEIYNSDDQKRIELCCTMLKILCKRHAAARDLLLRDIEGFLQAAYPKYIRSGNEKKND